MKEAEVAEWVKTFHENGYDALCSGSYPLYLYLKEHNLDVDWEPNDVDIYIQAKKGESIDKFTEKLLVVLLSKEFTFNDIITSWEGEFYFIAKVEPRSMKYNLNFICLLYPINLRKIVENHDLTCCQFLFDPVRLRGYPLNYKVGKLTKQKKAIRYESICSHPSTRDKEMERQKKYVGRGFEIWTSPDRTRITFSLYDYEYRYYLLDSDEGASCGKNWYLAMLKYQIATFLQGRFRQRRIERIAQARRILRRFLVEILYRPHYGIRFRKLERNFKKKQGIPLLT